MAVVTINAYKANTTDPVGSGAVNADFFISVKDSAGTEIGTVANNEINISDNVLTINSSAFKSLLAEQDDNILLQYVNGTDVPFVILNDIVTVPDPIALDGTAVINDSEGNQLYSLTVPAGGTVTQSISDSTAVVKRSDDSIIVSEPILAQASEDITIADSPITINSASATQVMAASTIDISIVDTDGATVVGEWDVANNRWVVGGGVPLPLEAPTDVIVTEDINGDVQVAWVDPTSPATDVQVWAEVVLGDGGTDVRQLYATLPLGTAQPYILTGQAGKEFIVDLQSTDGVTSTTGQDFTPVTGNAVSFTTAAPPDLAPSGVYLQEAFTELLTYNTPITFQAGDRYRIGIQELSTAGTDVGLMGTGSTTDRLLLQVSTNKIRGNFSTGTLRTSPAITPVLNVTSRNIIEFYVEDGTGGTVFGDMYFIPSEGATPQFLFNIESSTPGVSDILDINRLFRAGGKNTTGYIYYIDDGTDIYEFNELSGATITGSNSGVLTISSTQNVDNVWIPNLPTPPGFVQFDSLSVAGRTAAGVLSNLQAPTSNYTPGSTEYLVADIANGGYSHALVPLMTNDVANPSGFATPDEYKTNMLAIITELRASGIEPILGTAGTLVTSIKQGQKDYSTTIGAMLSGDPANPTPDSGWDFNVASTGVEAVLPLYVAKLNELVISESVVLVDAFADFIANQVPPYDQLITTDGTHYSTAGYDQYGATASAVITGLGVAVTKVAVLGDSLGNGIKNSTSAAYNN